MTASSKTHLTWLDPQWQAQARDWVEGQLVRSGRRLTGEIEQPHVRPWSTAWRIPTDTGPVWFKANGAGSAYEPGLLRALAGWLAELLQPNLI
ncbi:MAG TPA: hypothetical protein VFX60_16350 [Micromonospora sp.]|nr:hypothetical protein [Micromonospora sp.]